MTQHWENVWTFRTARFVVTLDCTWDDDADLSWDDTGEVREKIERGLWSVFLFRTRVTLDGREVGADYLGGSIYENASEFRDHLGVAAKSRAEGVNYGSYFPDMVREAIHEARKTLIDAPRIRATA